MPRLGFGWEISNIGNRQWHRMYPVNDPRCLNLSSIRGTTNKSKEEMVVYFGMNSQRLRDIQSSHYYQVARSGARFFNYSPLLHRCSFTGMSKPPKRPKVDLVPSVSFYAFHASFHAYKLLIDTSETKAAISSVTDMFPPGA